jgi:flagellar motor switch protein FliM/flagellar motor switch protein FliG
MKTNHNIKIDDEEINISARDNLEIIGSRQSPLHQLKVKTYDFMRPDKFSKDQIRTVQMMHETFARLTSTAISAHLKALVGVHVSVVDQLTYEEFIRSIPNPTILGIISMEPLRSCAVLELDPSASFAMIDAISGGKGESNFFARSLTDIELHILEGIFIKMAENVKKSWANVADIKPRLIKFETNPQFAQVVPPNDMIVLISMTIKVGEVEGKLNLCIPYITIEPILHKLSAKYWYSSIRKKEGLPLEMDIKKLDVGTDIYFECEKISLKEISKIKKNTLIRLPDYEDGICYLNAGGNTLYKMKQKQVKRNKPIKPFSFELMKQKEPLFKKDEYSQEASIEEKSSFKDSIPVIKSILTDFESAIKEKINHLDKKISISKIETPFLPDNGEDGIGYESYIAQSSVQKNPLSFIRHTDIEELSSFLIGEHPQVIAMILSCLDPGIAGPLLSSFDENLQVELSEKIAGIRSFPAEILKISADVIETKLRKPNMTEISQSNGIHKISEILNVASRSAEKNIISTLKNKNPELAEEIQSDMYIFENIALLDDKSIKLILVKIDRSDLLIALKTVDSSLQELFLRNLSEKDQSTFTEEFKKLNRIRLSEVEAAQQRIISIIREMEESGEIDIVRDGDVI